MKFEKYISVLKFVLGIKFHSYELYLFQTLELKHVNSKQCLGAAGPNDKDAPSIGKWGGGVCVTSDGNKSVSLSIGKWVGGCDK